ncbi:hypothetical protein K440DRAFT_645594 [Wilcoxina mikolae CBS 423.85]|nr:hypothetical protein K440DRAFT_645594 [Wilcoxina mikolae CBS 423.85]
MAASVARRRKREGQGREKPINRSIHPSIPSSHPSHHVVPGSAFTGRELGVGGPAAVSFSHTPIPTKRSKESVCGPDPASRSAPGCYVVCYCRALRADRIGSQVQPNPAHLPTGNERRPSSIAKFFELPWVKEGEAEVLFIKRAARSGDRWTAHVAFPGGKRDKEDAGDLEAAVRETLEEVGLDLEKEEGFRCGHLPDRVITTSWGTFPLMVLCPFVFLLTSPNPPALYLQPTEVASAHWVPLRLLLIPEFRTVETCDVADRLAGRGSGVLGLLVSLSVFSTFGKDFLAPAEAGKFESSLVLWGLTLGIVEDFIDMLPPIGGALGLWNWPTFTAWDVRRNFEIAKKESVEAAMLKDELCGRNSMEESIVDIRNIHEDEGEDIGESAVLVRPRAMSEPRRLEVKVRGERERISSFNTLIDGYYDIVRRAVWITMAGRAVVGTAVVGALIWRARK